MKNASKRQPEAKTASRTSAPVLPENIFADAVMSNTAFTYLYSDAANWKRYGNVTFAGDFTTEQEARLRVKFNAVLVEDSFIASQIGIPEVFLWNPDADYDRDDESTYPEDIGPGNYVISDDDHCCHEFDSLELVTSPANDPRTVEEFVCQVEAVDQWREFDPKDRKK